ncbi:MAG: aminopeptidase [Lachnospiraceae bacterium]|nr:aminopeptidase [Lachnospiraceae bacterium]
MEDIYISEKDRKDLEAERYVLAVERIRQISDESICEEQIQTYFRVVAGFVLLADKAWNIVENGDLRRMTLQELQSLNAELYRDVLPENYGNSYGNPDYAVDCLGESIGRMLSFLYTELRGMIPAAFEQNRFDMVIRMELLLEVYQAFVAAEQERAESSESTGQAAAGTSNVAPETLRQILYWYVSDYYEPESLERTAGLLDPARNFAYRIIMDSDLSDLRYLYYYGEYVTDSELRTAKHLNAMPEERIKLLADTYTEGYRIGFEVGNKDISIKKTVNVRYALGFERMIRQAVINFDHIGLQPTIYRAGANIFQGRSVNKNGFFGANPNKQFDYDHKEDQALVLDRLLVERKMECMKSAYERYKTEAAVFGGPAVVEIFGEKPFVPETKKAAYKLDEKQQKLSVEYAAKAGALQNEYIPGEQRSFTIIAFPVPDIGDRYEEIFDDIVRINTLDYKLYQGIQQKIIDALDLGLTVIVKGSGENRTEMTIRLHELHDPTKETNFENCVADVNIPVGEVFTSPVLAGTNGILHVTRVFLNELEYKDLWLKFEDGMVADYGCSNFPTEAENRKYIRENVMFHHDTLPLGEFAVGTNTTAYVAARKYGIEDKMPILIAEKTGPHFAVGDTCYSHAENVRVFNPDGKEIIAKDNEVSLLRDTDVSKAYFQCHTDITIPYDELGELSVLTKAGETIPIILDGQFVLAGCEELNRAFEE